MKNRIKICSYPVSISVHIYMWLKKYKNIGWIYNSYGNCFTHHFHKEKERKKFIKYIMKNYTEKEKNK